jgi:hypothetical protein
MLALEYGVSKCTDRAEGNEKQQPGLTWKEVLKALSIVYQ